ncbi:YfcE family phosphodiesterase [Pontiellaceae bacterium B12219]|nr:YfcE family phosphodiesterase [Pontiellaceae bacterium B12219]
MKIGILSDTHGNLSITEKCADVFRKSRVTAIFHCGDIGSFDVLKKLGELNMPVHAVLGNVDRFSNDWKFAPRPEGLQLHGRFGDITLVGKRIALLHSDDRARFNACVESGDYDFVFTGHSHEFHDVMHKNTRCINPGTAGRGAPNACAVLDLEGGVLEQIVL